MSDPFAPADRSAVMRAVKGRDTSPERALRRLLWARGGRYRLHVADLPGKPDIVLRRRRLAIFVNGCFWHGHECKRGARVPEANRAYWLGKIAANRARDEANQAALTAQGWRVEVVWECEMKDRPAIEARIESWLTKSSLPPAKTARGFAPLPSPPPPLRGPPPPR
ncbi:MAG: very short patch repair endonuclease [Caulobacteraceae bacterium]